MKGISLSSKLFIALFIAVALAIPAWRTVFRPTNQVHAHLLVVEIDSNARPKEPGFDGRIIISDRDAGTVVETSDVLRYCPGAISAARVIALDSKTGALIDLRMTGLAAGKLSAKRRIRAPKGISRWWLDPDDRLHCTVKLDPPRAQTPELIYHRDSDRWAPSGQNLPEDMIPEFVAGRLRLRDPQKNGEGALFTLPGAGSGSFAGRLPGRLTHVICPESGLRLTGEAWDSRLEVKTTVVNIDARYRDGRQDRFGWKRVGTYGDVFLICGANK